MGEALKEAERAYAEGEIPVGAVVVSNKRIIARGYNMTEKLQDVTAHAEMIALTAAANHFGSKYLQECTLYVTLEPCPMCASALKWAQLGSVVFGAQDEKFGYTNYKPVLVHPKTTVKKGVLADECSHLLVNYFKERRKEK